MTGPLWLLVASALGGLIIVTSPSHSVRETIGASLALASIAAIPVGYLLGAF